jgi:Ion transport protein.
VICGNVTGARKCPAGYVCLKAGDNPNHGYTNFDNFLWSMLTTFQLITLDYWENVYNMVRTQYPMSSCPVIVKKSVLGTFMGQKTDFTG